MRLLQFKLLIYLLPGFMLWACVKTLDDEVMPLPEERMTSDFKSGMTAWYINPTTRYDHGIMGDKVEAGGIWVEYRKRSFIYTVSDNQVFEDIQPRLFDLNGDEIPEIITILTDIDQGASVAVFGIHQNDLQLKAQSKYIGQTHRWLNIAAINDLDDDGTVELVWISTPHIGGILKVAHWIDNHITVIDSIAGVSNHKIGSRNMELSVVFEENNQKTLFVPDAGFEKLIGFQWNRSKLQPMDTIWQPIDYEIPLYLQLNFQVSDKFNGR